MLETFLRGTPQLMSSQPLFSFFHARRCFAQMTFNRIADVFNHTHGHLKHLSNKSIGRSRRFHRYQLSPDRLQDAFMRWKAVEYILALDPSSATSMNLAWKSEKLCSLVSLHCAFTQVLTEKIIGITVPVYTVGFAGIYAGCSFGSFQASSKSFVTPDPSLRSSFCFLH